MQKIFYFFLFFLIFVGGCTEESRNKMIKLADLRRQNISSEIERLSSMEEIKSRILGISEEEILNG